MAKLKAGAMTVDLATGGIYGDGPREDILESAEALLALLFFTRTIPLPP